MGRIHLVFKGNSDPRDEKWDWVVSDRGQNLYTKVKMPTVKKLSDWAEKEEQKTGRRASVPHI